MGHIMVGMRYEGPAVLVCEGVRYDGIAAVDDETRPGAHITSWGAGFLPFDEVVRLTTAGKTGELILPDGRTGAVVIRGVTNRLDHRTGIERTKPMRLDGTGDYPHVHGA
jgi:hypothetical protein